MFCIGKMGGDANCGHFEAMYLSLARPGYALDGILAYTLHMLWILFSYCQLASRMRVYFLSLLLQCDARFHGGFQATPGAIEIQTEDISGWGVRLSPFLHVNFFRALGGSRSFHKLRLPFMLILTLICKYKYMGQSQGKKQGTVCSDFI